MSFTPYNPVSLTIRQKTYLIYDMSAIFHNWEVIIEHGYIKSITAVKNKNDSWQKTIR
jgi:hypothetical protein